MLNTAVPPAEGKLGRASPSVDEPSKASRPTDRHAAGMRSMAAMSDSTCDWPDCGEPGTHRVLFNYSDGRTETRRVCRDHDDAVKAKVRQNVGPKPTDPPANQLPATVACGECGCILDESQSLPVEQRQPCLDCGSTKRQIRVTIEERLELHDSLAVTGTRAGQPNRKWFQRSASGDSFTRDHDAWGGRIVEMNRETDSYREALVFWDGTTLESTARLRDHGEPDRRRRT